MFGDYHVHCYLSRHGIGEIEEYVESAIFKGLKRIGFSEHIPIPGLDDPTGRMPIEDFDTYINDVEKARQRYKGDIEVLFGLEADFLPAFQDSIQRFIQQYSFDYVIGSVHFIGDWDFSNPAYKDEFVKRGVDQVFTAYYQLVAQAAESGCYDVIGHLDLLTRYGYKPSYDLNPTLTLLLDKIATSGCALDVNSSGMRRRRGVIYPHPAILAKARCRDIPVVLGSDAHRPEDVAAGFNRAMQLLVDAGYSQSCYFRQRSINYEPLMARIAPKAR